MLNVECEKDAPSAADRQGCGFGGCPEGGDDHHLLLLCTTAWLEQ